MLTTQEAADELGLTQSRVRQLRIDGHFPWAQKLGRDWLIPRSDVEAFKAKPGIRRRKKIRIGDTVSRRALTLAQAG